MSSTGSKKVPALKTKNANGVGYFVDFNSIIADPEKELVLEEEAACFNMNVCTSQAVVFSSPNNSLASFIAISSLAKSQEPIEEPPFDVNLDKPAMVENTNCLKETVLTVNIADNLNIIPETCSPEEASKEILVGSETNELLLEALSTAAEIDTDIEDDIESLTDTSCEDYSFIDEADELMETEEIMLDKNDLKSDLVMNKDGESNEDTGDTHDGRLKNTRKAVIKILLEGKDNANSLDGKGTHTVYMYKCDIQRNRSITSVKTRKMGNAQKSKCSTCVSGNCPNCLSNNVGLQTDLDNDKKRKPGEIKCPTCTLYLDKTNILEHLQTVHGLEHLCENCEKSTDNTTKLKKHICKYHNNKMYKCKYCKFKTMFPSTMTQHYESHTLTNGECEKPYKCDVCDKTFVCNANLKTHQILHQEVKPYICSICNKGFAQKNNWKLHMSKHGNVLNLPSIVTTKDGKCSALIEDSGGKFKNKLQFSCEICGNMFRWKHDMKRHVKTVHLGQKEFQCDQCDKSFVDKSAMHQHITSNHIKHKAYKCTLCDRSYFTKYRLSDHAERKHGLKVLF